MRWIIAAAIVMFSATAWGEEVQYCTESDSTGFYWNKGAVEGERTGFKLSRYIVNIISEMTGGLTTDKLWPPGSRQSDSSTSGIANGLIRTQRTLDHLGFTFYRSLGGYSEK